MIQQVTIYALCDPGSESVRYVGKTIGTPRRRLVHHLCKARRGVCQLPLSRWCRKVLAAGERPIVRELEVVPVDAWVERERHWIRHYRATSRLLNVTDGGEGTHGYKWAGTERARKLSAAYRRGATFNCERCGTPFYRKRKEIKTGDCRFCSRDCYLAWQVGKSKPMPRHITEAGIAAAAKARLARTHCKRGHPYSEENTYINSRGARVCKTCYRASKRKYLERINGR